MAYLSISGRPGKLTAAVVPVGETYSVGFDVEMRDGVLMFLTFDKETALQWAAELTKAFEGEGK